MGISPARFNEIAKAMGLGVLWDDKNKDGKRTKDELSSQVTGADLASEAEKVDQHFAKISSQAKSVLIKNAPRETFLREALVVGNPVLTRELRTAVESHGDKSEAVQTISPMDGVAASATTRTIGGLNLDGDSHPDFLIVQSFEIYVGSGEEDKHETVSFLAMVSGTALSDKSGIPTNDMIKTAKLLEIAAFAGNSNPIPELSVIKGKAKKLDKIAYQVFDPLSQSFVSKTVDPKAGASVSSDLLYNSLFRINAYFENTTGYLIAPMLAQFSKGASAEEFKANFEAVMYNRLSFAFNELGRRYDVLKSDASGDVVDGVNLPFARVLTEDARKVLIMSEADKNLEAELKASTQRAFIQERSNFLWKGEKMGRQKFYDSLAAISDPKEREALAQAFSAATIASMQQDGGLFQAIDKLNEMAQRYGYRDYADLALKVYNFTDIESFEAMMDQVQARDGKEIDDFLADLKAVNGGNPVNEWDVAYLTEKMIMERAGIKEVPKIGRDDAIKVIKKYYASIGIDLDKPPYAGNITFDIKERADKYQNAAVEGIGDGGKTWFTGNFSNEGEMTLYNMGLILHELGHAIQFMTGSGDVAGGNYNMNAINSQTVPFAEGYAISMQYRVYDPVFMDKYLAELPQFSDPKVRQVVSDAKRREMMYEQMKVMVRARQEIELYRTKDKDGKYRSVEERMEAMADIARRYLHVGNTPDKLDFWSIPHPCGNNLIYSVYSTARTTAELVSKDVIEAMRGRGKVEDSAATALKVFKQGARLRTQEDIRAFVEQGR